MKVSTRDRTVIPHNYQTLPFNLSMTENIMLQSVLFTFLVGRRRVSRQTVRLPRPNVPITGGLPPPPMKKTVKEMELAPMIVVSFLNIYAFTSVGLGQIITLTTFFVLTILGIIEIWAFFWMLRHNKQKYEIKLKEGNHKLSERYQLSENIRTAKQLIPCILMHFVCIILPGINSCLIYIHFYKDTFTFDFVNQCIFTIISVGSFLIELFMIIFHPFLKRDLLRILHLIRSCRCVRIFASNSVAQDPSCNDQNIAVTRRKTVGAFEPLDINGKPLISDGQKEDLGRAYFKQLAISWQ
uniref:G protein-coupled receptor n=1 Tax=Meloidogyne javanica TaxID=6303 RepID=A0A915N1J6_MELJA